MTLQDTLLTIVVGGLLGIIGQLLRTIVGMKKMKDEGEEVKKKNEEINTMNAANASNIAAANSAINTMNVKGINAVPVDPVPTANVKPLPAPKFEPAKFLYSLAIGFVAGALGSLFVEKLTDIPAGQEQKVYLAIIGMGYAGADFIEGLVGKLWNKQA